MPIERIAKLVRIAAGDANLVSALKHAPAKLVAPLQLTNAHLDVLQSGRIVPTVRSPSVAAPASATTLVSPAPGAADVLLPPEGCGQAPPAVFTSLSPINAPTPAPSRRPVPAGPSRAPTMPQPAPSKGFPTAQPAPMSGPFAAPTPLPSSPWPAPSPQAPSIYQAPSLPPQYPTTRYGAPTVPAYSAPASPVTQQPTLPRAPAYFSGQTSCTCPSQLIGIVATTAATTQTSLTAITALAQGL